MNKRKILDFFTLLNLISITYLTYFMFRYIDLVSKNQIKATNINIYIYFLVINVAMFVKRLTK